MTRKEQNPTYSNLQTSLTEKAKAGEVRYRTTYCGPTVLLLLTGAPYDEIKAKINRARNDSVRKRYSERMLQINPHWLRKSTSAVRGLEVSTMIKVMSLYGIKSNTKDFPKSPTLRAACEDLKFIKKRVLFVSGTHYLLLDDGKLYDTFQTEGAPFAEHPFAKTKVQKCWVLDGKAASQPLAIEHALNARFIQKVTA